MVVIKLLGLATSLDPLCQSLPRYLVFAVGYSFLSCAIVSGLLRIVQKQKGLFLRSYTT